MSASTRPLPTSLEIRTHYGAPLWARVDPGFEGANLDLWDKQEACPCAVWLPGSDPTRDYWSQIAAQLRTTLTISDGADPSGLWVALKVPAIKRSKYPFSLQGAQVCRSGDPPAGLHPPAWYLGDPPGDPTSLAYGHTTGNTPERIQQALSVLLQDLFLPASEGSYVTTSPTRPWISMRRPHPGSRPPSSSRSLRLASTSTVCFI